MDDVGRIVTAEELASILKVSKSHVYDAAAEGAIPCLRIGKAVRFDVAAVLAAISGSAT